MYYNNGSYELYSKHEINTKKPKGGRIISQV